MSFIGSKNLAKLVKTKTFLFSILHIGVVFILIYIFDLLDQKEAELIVILSLIIPTLLIIRTKNRILRGSSKR